MKNVFIIDGLRTPLGARGGSLKDISASRLAAVVITALLKNNKIKAKVVDEIILGNAVSAGLGQNPARQALVYAGLPYNIPAFTINKVCGSGLKSVILGIQAILCGDADLIIAGGTENASQCPYILARDKKNENFSQEDLGDSLIHDGLWCSLNNQHMGTIAEYTAERFKISRAEQDKYALESHRKACLAQKQGAFTKEITPVKIAERHSFAGDERPRRTSLEKLGKFPPVFKPKGTITAGNSPAPADGAAALILASEKALHKFSLTPAARIQGYATAAVNPKLTFTAPALAINKCLQASALRLSEIDLFEINEAFAVQSLLTIRELSLDLKRLNILGGTIALGHPLGASGARGLVTLINALKTQKKEIGLTSVCLGGGGAVSLAIRVLR
ncbi:MAG: thiolase family protein [Elusimicrobia bacterium]|nr:thiolase family protein [Elusimicrobiota bacterium]